MNNCPCGDKGHILTIKVKDFETYRMMVLHKSGKRLVWQAKHIEQYDGTIIKDCGLNFEPTK